MCPTPNSNRQPAHSKRRAIAQGHGLRELLSHYAPLKDNKLRYELNSDTRIGQSIIMFFSIIIFLFALSFHNMAADTRLLIAVSFGMLFFNWLSSKSRYIYVENGKFYIKSIYAKTKVIEGELFDYVDVIIPGQSYYYLYLKNGKRYTFGKRLDLITILKHGEKGRIEQMNQEINHQLAEINILMNKGGA
jgi:hypothetical protein